MTRQDMNQPSRVAFSRADEDVTEGYVAHLGETEFATIKPGTGAGRRPNEGWRWETTGDSADFGTSRTLADAKEQVSRLARTVGRPLVVFSVLGYCDTHYEHEHRLVTDGTRAYATGLHADTDLVHRDGTLVSFDCTDQDPRTGQPCHGRLEWRLDEPDTWTADADAINLLEAHGTAVES